MHDPDILGKFHRVHDPKRVGPVCQHDLVDPRIEALQGLRYIGHLTRSSDLDGEFHLFLDAAREGVKRLQGSIEPGYAPHRTICCQHDLRRTRV